MTDADAAKLELDGVCVRYGDATVVEDLSLRVGYGEITALVGPSGCGKTTLLRLIAGFEAPVSGRVLIDGSVAASIAHWVPPEARGVGVVFQDHVLFPHLDVAANITFGLRASANGLRRARLAELVQLVGLRGLESRYPHELSGGQQQRVALARALAPRPALLLLDEPFASLDQQLRNGLAAEVRDILRRSQTAAILVTHDITEAFAFADRIGVMRAGRLLQWGRADALYRRPADRYVAEFVGQGRFIEAEVTADGRLTTALGELRCPVPCAHPPGTRVELLLRAEDLAPATHGGVDATVLRRAFRGIDYLYTLGVDSAGELLAVFPQHSRHIEGDSVRVCLSPHEPVYFAHA